MDVFQVDGFVYIWLGNVNGAENITILMRDAGSSTKLVLCWLCIAGHHWETERSEGQVMIEWLTPTWHLNVADIIGMLK